MPLGTERMRCVTYWYILECSACREEERVYLHYFTNGTTVRHTQPQKNGQTDRRMDKQIDR